MSCLSNISPEQLTLIACLIGLILSQELDSNEQNILGNLLTETGQTLLTVGAQTQNQNDQQQNEDQILLLSQQIENLNLQINVLKRQMKK